MDSGAVGEKRVFDKRTRATQPDEKCARHEDVSVGAFRSLRPTLFVRMCAQRARTPGSAFRHGKQSGRCPQSETRSIRKAVYDKSSGLRIGRKTPRTRQPVSSFSVWRARACNRGDRQAFKPRRARGRAREQRIKRQRTFFEFPKVEGPPAHRDTAPLRKEEPFASSRSRAPDKVQERAHHPTSIKIW